METYLGVRGMSLKERIFSFPGLAIAGAFCAIVLGALVTLRLVHNASACAANVVVPNFPNVWEIAGIAALVVAMVVLKTIGDRRFRLERDLLQAFLEHIPEHVYFK
ncbi:MAG: hypothetical protein ACRD3S_12800, partial [Terracidiphilus sp.]